jgi:hypothetical protein
MRTVAYLGIDAVDLPNLRACVENWPNSAGCNSASPSIDNGTCKGLVANLLARGILTTIATPTRAPECKYPTTALANPHWGGRRRRTPITHLLLVSMALLRVQLFCRRRGLAAILGWIRRHQATVHRYEKFATRQKSAELLESFFRLRIWFYTAFRHCLFDSLVLSVLLTSKQIPCTLVIGVSTKPFAAHAWVQIDECVLNDTIEHILLFTPIFAVGDCK